MMLGKNDAGQKLCRTDINHYVGQKLCWTEIMLDKNDVGRTELMQDRIGVGQKLCWTEMIQDRNYVGQTLIIM